MALRGMAKKCPQRRARRRQLEAEQAPGSGGSEHQPITHVRFARLALISAPHARPHRTKHACGGRAGGRACKSAMKRARRSAPAACHHASARGRKMMLGAPWRATVKARTSASSMPCDAFAYVYVEHSLGRQEVRSIGGMQARRTVPPIFGAPTKFHQRWSHRPPAPPSAPFRPPGERLRTRAEGSPTRLGMPMSTTRRPSKRASSAPIGDGHTREGYVRGRSDGPGVGEGGSAACAAADLLARPGRYEEVLR